MAFFHRASDAAHEAVGKAFIANIRICRSWPSDPIFPAPFPIRLDVNGFDRRHCAVGKVANEIASDDLRILSCVIVGLLTTFYSAFNRADKVLGDILEALPRDAEASLSKHIRFVPLSLS